ncbi:hypothetical protein L917_03052 [Phytophthora nicotianae]|uniref:Uncharacterized protein n=1 Tax=Phytophthora nicotianae TaxID=4792 RepID=W2LU33_PHYNI|nr:hypothetical protein L917_03052 [Phytophthora nicotianae]ETM53398.1 hypothetical protein L914_03124 [Phytophthora nicotianae]
MVVYQIPTGDLYNDKLQGKLCRNRYPCLYDKETMIIFPDQTVPTVWLSFGSSTILIHGSILTNNM